MGPQPIIFALRTPAPRGIAVLLLPVKAAETGEEKKQQLMAEGGGEMRPLKSANFNFSLEEGVGVAAAYATDRLLITLIYVPRA